MLCRDYVGIIFPHALLSPVSQDGSQFQSCLVSWTTTSQMISLQEDASKTQNSERTQGADCFDLSQPQEP